MTDYAVRIKGIGKRFVRSSGGRSLWRQMLHRGDNADHFWALKDVDIDIRRGESFGLIGPNGAGKSTLLKIVSRILLPTEGEIELYGRVNSLLEVGTGFEPDLTGRANVYLNGAILGMSRKEIGAIYDEIVEFSGLRDFMDMPVKQYSSGMYARLAFSVAAYVTGDILAVDEVLSVGDAEFRRKSMRRMEDLMTAGGRTIIFVSHSTDAIARFCDRAAWLEKGCIREIGPADEIVRDYLGAAAGNRTTSFVESVKRDAIQSAAAPNGEPATGKSSAPAAADNVAADPAATAEQEAEPQAAVPEVSYLVRRSGIDDRESAGRIENVRLVDERGAPRAVVFRDESQFVEFDFEISRDVTPPIACFFWLRCLPRKGVPADTVVFSHFSTPHTYARGRYTARVEIPANLLTSATYNVGLSLKTIGRPMISHDTLKRVIEFQVLDRDPHADVGAEAMFGIIRLDLDWTISQHADEREVVGR